MLAQVTSCAVVGLEGALVQVEVDVSNGGPYFSIVGLPDAAVQEARERVRSAIRNSGAHFPYNQRLTVNLAPADLRKEGPAYDLPMALALVMASGGANPDLEGAMVVGELSLDGSVRHTNGILPMVSVARQRGLKRVYVPARDAAEAALVEGLEVYPVPNLAAMLDHLNGASRLARFEMPPMPKDEEVVYPVDMADVKGQEHVKRAVEVAAAGAHNVLGLWTTIQLPLCAADRPGVTMGRSRYPLCISEHPAEGGKNHPGDAPISAAWAMRRELSTDILVCASLSPAATAKEGPMERVISNDGTPIAYNRSGSGAPLILVHGTSGTSTRWAPILPALGEHFAVYAIDRRGRGESGDGEPYAIEREFEDVAAVADAIGEPVHLLGHSFGGLCALEAALRTRNLRKLVLYEPPIPLPGVLIYPEGVIDRLQALLDAGDREGVVATFMREVVRMPPREFALFRSSPAWPARVAAAHTLPRELRAQTQYEFAAQRFRQLQTPTLLLLGGDSPYFLKAAIEALSTILPNSQVAVMPGQQHIAIDTAPELFVREVAAFLAEPEAH